MKNHELTALPNIGKTLTELLQSAGINSISDLSLLGSEQAFLRLQAIDPEACYSKLCALEGAIQGIRWHDLSKERKMELKIFFNQAKRH